MSKAPTTADKNRFAVRLHEDDIADLDVLYRFIKKTQDWPTEYNVTKEGDFAAAVRRRIVQLGLQQMWLRASGLGWDDDQVEVVRDLPDELAEICRYFAEGARRLPLASLLRLIVSSGKLNERSQSKLGGSRK